MNALHGRLLLRRCQLEVLTELPQIIDHLALGLRRRLLHLLLLGRSRARNADNRCGEYHWMRLHHHLLLNLLSIHWRWRHVSCMMRMGNMHWRFTHRLHLARHLLGSERWRRFIVVDRGRTRILPHGALRQRLSITIYIHATAVRHVPSTVSVHLVHIIVTIYNWRLNMLRRWLLWLLMWLMLHVSIHVL